MVSLRFPFLFSPPTNLKALNNVSSSAAVVIAAAAGVVVVGIQTHQREDPFLQKAFNLFLSHCPPTNSNLPMWGSLSLADNSVTEEAAVVESKTGASFPTVLGVSRRLLGIGLRKKSVLGLKNIDVYAFGVYADEANIKNMLNEKYDKLSVSELKGNKQFYEDVINNDISMTVRLQIVYGRLSIGSVRSAFEESIGSRLQKFGGADNKELLQRFTSMFKDEYKIPRGSVIELSREPKHVLRATIDGKEIGSIQSKLLCRSVLDLYIGEDPFDKRAKEDVEANLASLAR
ncbi:hypothetical protein Syun_007482 [Stephania yunnanensis]|uniref:Chalcone isomerase domain-containing protein n=1 Tax=Stephania yunnanensis TaxID=152371 RepID=A0AAP0Q2F1_9MAGN